MTSADEPVSLEGLESLGEMPVLVSDPARAARLRARCHAHLARRRRRDERGAAVVGFARGVLGPAIVVGLCAVYVAALVGTVVSLVLRRA